MLITNDRDKRYIDDFYGEIEQTNNFDYSGFTLSNDEEDPFDYAIDDIDFSFIEGKDFKKSFSKADKLVTKKIAKKTKRKKPLEKKYFVKKRATIEGDVERKINKVIVPRDRKVVIEGVSNFILDEKNEAYKNIGYHEGRKLKSMVLTINNDSAIDFNVQLFNPSMPLEYLYSTSLNLNDKIVVGGGEVSYTDVLFNILANPMMMYQAKFVFGGANVSEQMSQSLKFINKNSSAFAKIDPVNVSLMVDPYQYLDFIVTFDFKEVLNRPYVPDGMDTIQYKILPNTSVAMAFFYDQLQIKRIMYEQAAKSKILL